MVEMAWFVWCVTIVSQKAVFDSSEEQESRKSTLKEMKHLNPQAISVQCVIFIKSKYISCLLLALGFFMF